MKRFLVFAILAATMLIAFPKANAQFISPDWGFGVEVGGARGDNGGGAETWQPRYRFHIQHSIIPQLGIQIGSSYTEFKATNIYSTQTAMLDVRLLYSPFQLKESFPYIFAGFGVTKDWGGSISTNYLPIIPIGIGIETSVGPSLLLHVNTSYNLSLSDELDGRVRSDRQLNNITNGRNDAFYDIMVGLVYCKPKSSLDLDNDGLSSREENEHGTNPRRADTDNDGLSDGDEVTLYHTNPRNPDSDDDGLRDGEEVMTYNTNPAVADTDEDGLIDGNEVHRFHSNPKSVDSDNDGLLDGVEVNQYHTNPMMSDTDGDGLADAHEIHASRTDPLKADTDGDGLNDGSEVDYHSNPLVLDTDGDGLNDGDEVNIYSTDPSKVDTDGDGLSDAAELNQHRTNPLMVDSDNGGMVDGAELRSGKNPLDPMDDLFDLTSGRKVVLNGINFGSDLYSILPESESVLEKARESLVAYPEATVILSGYTDSVGDEDSNRTLSLRRAQAVKDWLVERGIVAGRIKIVGMGETEPIALNDTAEGRAQNRRMEFLVE